MPIIRERKVEDETARELIQVRDVVKLIESPLDRLKKGGLGKVKAIHGDMMADPHVLMEVVFKLGGKNFTLVAEADRFRFSKHPKTEVLPDSLNEIPLTETEEE